MRKGLILDPDVARLRYLLAAASRPDLSGSTLKVKTERRMAKKGSVLVVDDEEIMREVLETLLVADGYRVDLAKTGEEGLEAYGRRAFDAVLLDVSMPGIGGNVQQDRVERAAPIS